MKKFLMAAASVAFLTLAPMAAMADCTATGVSIEDAKGMVAKWDKAAAWEYLKSGAVFDALIAWYKVQGVDVSKVDGIVVTHATKSDGAEIVLFALSEDGVCVGTTPMKMTKNQYDALVGKEI